MNEDKKETSSELALVRKNPPLFPMGFRFSSSESICIVDFCDVQANESVNVFFSIAITKEMAKDLSDKLNDFISEE